MKIVFWHSDKGRERSVSSAFVKGAMENGDQAEAVSLTHLSKPQAYDVGCFIGVKGFKVFEMHRKRGLPAILFDKGYLRSPGGALGNDDAYWRVGIGSHQPTEYLMDVSRPSDRWDRLGFSVKPWREAGKRKPILIAGSSAKYHRFYGLPHPTDYWDKVATQIRGMTKRAVIYRQKPSWKDAERLPESGVNPTDIHVSIRDALQGVHALVTHGSNACFEAILEGVPCVVLGPGAARPISSTRLDEVLDPRVPTDGERLQWLYNLAYCQFTVAEFASGYAWSVMRGQVR